MDTAQWKMAGEILAAANEGHVTRNEAEEILDAYFLCVERYCEQVAENFNFSKVAEELEREIREIVRKVQS